MGLLGDGGVPAAAPIVLSQKEIVARLKEIGANAAVPNPHTIYMVEDPSPILAYQDRSVADNCFTAVPIGHFELFKFSMHRMVLYRATFYRDREAAWQDAEARAKEKK